MSGNPIKNDKLDMLCPLCGTNPAQHDGKKYIGQEHIPPRCIFIDRADPQGLIKVPSCEPCNNGTSDSDEHFRYHLSLYLGVNTPEKMALWQNCRKTFQKKKSWANAILKRTSLILMRYGHGYGYPAKGDARVVKTVITKMVKGLHWHVTGEIIPPEIVPEVFIIEQGKKIPQQMMEIFEKYGRSIQKCGTQFEVIYGVAEETQYASMWLLRFYGEDCFNVYIQPPSP